MVNGQVQPSPEPLVRISAVRKAYATGGTIVHALAGLDLTVTTGTTLAIVGESGAGKSTLARCMAGLEHPGEGEISFQGRPVPRFGDPQSIWFHRQVQLVLQDSATALNSRFTAEQIIAEPMIIQKVGDSRERHERVRSLMSDVGLAADLVSRRPRQLSGGQRQRLAIARALALQPSLIIFDEAFSGLDLRVQKQIALLLRDLQRRRGLTFVYISHDLALMAVIASEIAIMFDGQIVERGATADVLCAPTHPHTRALVAAIPGTHRASAPSGVGC